MKRLLYFITFIIWGLTANAQLPCEGILNGAVGHWGFNDEPVYTLTEYQDASSDTIITLSTLPFQWIQIITIGEVGEDENYLPSSIALYLSKEGDVSQYTGVDVIFCSLKIDGTIDENLLSAHIPQSEISELGGWVNGIFQQTLTLSWFLDQSTKYAILIRLSQVSGSGSVYLHAKKSNPYSGGELREPISAGVWAERTSDILFKLYAYPSETKNDFNENDNALAWTRANYHGEGMSYNILGGGYILNFFDGYEFGYSWINLVNGFNSANKNLTVSIWIYPLSGIKNNKYILSKLTSGGRDGFKVSSDGSSFEFSVNGTSVSSSTTPTVGYLYHLVGTYDGSNVKIYVNGSLQGTSAETGNMDNSNPWEAGYPTFTFAGEFKGAVDEVTVLDNTWSDSQVAYIYNSGTPMYVNTWACEAAGSVYYVSNSGNDNNTGLSEVEAWKTLSKVNGSSFNPGDQILLKRGDIWRESITMPSSGSLGNHIYIGAYGQGDNPIIDGSDLLTSWTQENLSESEDVLMEPQEMVEQKESIFRWWSRKYVATGFTATGTYDLTTIEVNLDKVGSPTMNINCYLYSSVGNNPTSVLAISSTTLNAANITNGTWHSFTFDGSYKVQNNTFYWIVLVASIADDNNYVYWNSRSSGGVIVGSETGEGEWEKIVGWNGSYRIKGTSASFTSYWATTTSPNAAWEDGLYMIKKQSKESLSKGSFYWDGGNNRVYVRTSGDDSPSGHVIASAKRDYGITSNDKTHISIDGITVRYTNVGGITATTNSSYIYVSNSELYGNGIGVNFHGANGLVTKSTIRNGHMIVNDLSPYNDYGAVGVNIENVNITVSYSTFENLYASSFDYGEDGGGIEVFQYAIPVVENIEIYNNYFKNVSGILEVGGSGGTIRNVTAYNNISYDDRPWNGGIAINNAGGYGVSIDNITLFNNTIVSVGSNSGAYMWFASNPSAGHFVMKNNIFYVSNVTVITAQTLQLADHTNNLYWNPLNGAWTPGYTLGNGELIDNPLFVNAENDFRLLSASPAIDAGVNVSVPKDFLDNSRIGLPDIGAYEYMPEGGIFKKSGLYQNIYKGGVLQEPKRK